jgi:predicted nucleic acid-binding protein
MGLIEDVGRGPVAIDTAPFVYFIEEHPDYLPVVLPLFQAVDQGRVAALTSELTLLEVLVVPYRSGDIALAERYEAVLARGRGLKMKALTRSLLKGAAMLRARTGLKIPDSIQLAAALAGRCTALVTNDRDFKQVDGLKVLQLRNYLVTG